MSGAKRTSRRQAAAAEAREAAAAAQALATDEVTIKETVAAGRKIAPKPHRQKKAVQVTVKTEVKVEETVISAQTLLSQDPVPAESPDDPLPATPPPKKRARKTPAIKKTPAVKKPKKESAKKPAKVKKEVKPKAPRKKKAVVHVDVHKNCPKSTSDRIKKVVTQRMFLIDRERVGDELKEEYSMLGSTSNVYTCHISEYRNRCDCPDFIMRNNPCKHLLFVFIKVLRIPTDSELVLRSSFTPLELRRIFDAAPPAPADAMVQDHIRAAFRGEAPPAEGDKVTTKPDGTPLRREPVEGDDCPVCYSEMEAEEELEYCESVGGCGRPLHAECFKMWSQTSRSKGQAVTCVWCRTEWKGSEVVASQGRAKVIQGATTTTAFYRKYTNLGALAG